jgi:hypothetical protein
MGYLAKKNTEKKAAPATGPIGFEFDSSTWHTTGRVTAAAIIREAALDLNLKGSYSDINRSGRQNMLAGAIAGAMTSVDTVLWIHETGGMTWEVWIGAVTLDGKMSKDWLCAVTVRANTVEIRTPQYFTKDGAMLKAKFHDQFRTAVFERMAIGSTREPGDSLALSRNTIARSGVGDMVEPICQGADNFSGSSTLPVETLAQDFVTGKFGFPPIEARENYWRYGLGLPSGWAENWAEITFRPDAVPNGGTLINGTLRLSGTGSRGVQTIATNRRYDQIS